MKALVVDREDVTAQLIKSKLGPHGHEVFHEVAKNAAIERMASEPFDMVFIDPSPLTTARPTVLSIRRAVKSYPYILLMSEDSSEEDGLKSGANDVLGKPLDSTLLDGKVENAKRLTSLVHRIGDDSEDFPSAGGVIAKSAFNQLFLSALERSDRYAEKTYILFIGISNYKDLVQMEGAYGADYAVARLSKYLVLLRRQSDIIGQTAKYEYALLLQRPGYEDEPMEAARRFAEALQGTDDIVSPGSTPVEITVSLIDVPVGRLLFDYTIRQEVSA